MAHDQNKTKRFMYIRQQYNGLIQKSKLEQQ